MAPPAHLVTLDGPGLSRPYRKGHIVPQPPFHIRFIQLHRCNSVRSEVVASTPMTSLDGFRGRPQLVLVGDSLTERAVGPKGLVALLAEQYSRKAGSTLCRQELRSLRSLVRYRRTRIQRLQYQPYDHPTEQTSQGRHLEFPGRFYSLVYAICQVNWRCVQHRLNVVSVSVSVGANDAAEADSIQPQQHVSLMDFASNLEMIIMMISNQFSHLDFMMPGGLSYCSHIV